MLLQDRVKYKSGSTIGIDARSFASNLKLIRGMSRPDTKLMLVVKSNAYGHGLGVIARLGIQSKVDFFGVAKPEEAISLRKLKIGKAILLLAPAHPSCVKDLVLNNVSFTVSNARDAQELADHSNRFKRKIRVHFKVDTGMGRFGSSVEKALSEMFKIQKIKSISLEGVYSHFPDACNKNSLKIRRQIETFGMLVSLFNELNPKTLKYTHLSNSAAVFNYPESLMSMVRVGISAYGINPGIQHKKIKSLKPVLSWESFVSSIKEFKPGQTLSYDRTYQIKRNTRIAVVPVGYASGYPIACSGKGRVLISGKSYPIVGRITMDFMMVDLGRDSGVELWDKVVIVGSSKKKSISVEEIAAQIGTIPYEVVCGLSESIPRIER